MFEPFLIDCTNLIKTFPNHSMMYVFRKPNYYADHLAYMRAELISNFQFLYNPPSVVVDLLLRVKARFVCCNRFIVK